MQYLKTTYLVGSKTSKQKTDLYLDADIHQTSKDNYSIQAYKNAAAYTNCNILITHPDGKQTKLEAGADGCANFTAPGPGLFLVDIEWIDKTPGKFKEKRYETIRYKMDFSLYN